MLEYFQLTGKTLYGKSDQTIESIHQEFYRRIHGSGYFVKNIKSDTHGIKLLKGVNHFNAYNVGYHH